jgi:hypothetical protein
VRRFKKGDLVCVKGLSIAFVFGHYINDNEAVIFIEGEIPEKRHLIVTANPKVLVPNDRPDPCVIEPKWPKISAKIQERKGWLQVVHPQCFEAILCGEVGYGSDFDSAMDDLERSL